jgi:hypothetical protein
VLKPKRFEERKFDYSYPDQNGECCECPDNQPANKADYNRVLDSSGKATKIRPATESGAASRG